MSTPSQKERVASRTLWGVSLNQAEQGVTRRAALGAHRPDDRVLHILQPVAHLLQAAPVGEETERTPAADLDQSLDLGGHGVVVGAGVAIVVGRQRRLIEQRLFGKVEDGGEHVLLAGLAHAAALLEVFEVVVGGQRGAGADDRTRHRLVVLFRVKEILAEQLGGIDGRGVDLDGDPPPVIDAHGIAHEVVVVAVGGDLHQLACGAADRFQGQFVAAALLGRLRLRLVAIALIGTIRDSRP